MVAGNKALPEISYEIVVAGFGMRRRKVGEATDETVLHRQPRVFSNDVGYLVPGQLIELEPHNVQTDTGGAQLREFSQAPWTRRTVLDMLASLP
jgi:hypothetical protein